DDVDIAMKNAVALDEASVVQTASAEKLTGLANDLVTFDVLEADVEQAYARPRDVEHVTGHDRAHQRELQQMLSRATDVSAEIEHVRGALEARHGRDDRRTIDTGQRFQDVPGGRH